MASSSRSRQRSRPLLPEPEPQDEPLRVTRLADTRPQPAAPVLRGEPGRTLRSVDQMRPLWPHKVRAKQLAYDRSQERPGIECASCGRIWPVQSYSRISTRRSEISTGDPRTVSAICRACIAVYEKIQLSHDQQDSQDPKIEAEIRRKLQRHRAKEKVRTQRVAVREREKARKQGVQARKKLEQLTGGSGDGAVERELLNRELCRRSLMRFTQRFEGMELVGEDDQERLKRTGKGLHLGWFHRFVLHRLQRFLDQIIAGAEPNLILRTPPRHGKSTMASRMLPAWALGLYPELEIIAASYGSALPIEFSRFVRTLLQDKAFKSLFPHSALHPSKQQLTGWGTIAGGQYLPAGVGTGIGGRGADILVIDDPVKDQEEADSLVIQERNMAWYLSTANARLSPLCGKLIIQTCWGDGDISAQLIRIMNDELREQDEREQDEREHILANVPEHDLQQMCALRDLAARSRQERDLIEQWEVIDFPAIAERDEYVQRTETTDHQGRPAVDEAIVYEPVDGAIKVRSQGDPLHPERFTARRLQRVKRTMVRAGEERIWNSLYQVRSGAGAGVHFTEDMFTREAALQPHQYSKWTILQAWDPAIGVQRENDATAGGTGALDPDGRLHVLHLVHGRMGPGEIAKAMIAEYERFEDETAKGVFGLGIEYGVISLALEDSLEHALEETNKLRRELGKIELSVPPYLQGEERLVPLTDKLVRASPSKAWHRSGRVLYPDNATWFDLLRGEHTGFMAGARHDDCVDFMSWLVRMARRAPLPDRLPAQQDAYAHGRRGWRERMLAKRRGRTAWQAA